MRCGGEGLSAWQVLVKVMIDFIMAIQHARCNTQDATPKMQHPRCNTQDATPKHATCRFRRGFDSSWPCTTQTIRSAGLPPPAEAHARRGLWSPWRTLSTLSQQAPHALCTRSHFRSRHRQARISDGCAARALHSTARCRCDAVVHRIGVASHVLLQRRRRRRSAATASPLRGQPDRAGAPPTASKQANKQTSGRAAMHEQANNPSGKPSPDGTGRDSAAQRSAAQPGDAAERCAARKESSERPTAARTRSLPLAPARTGDCDWPPVRSLRRRADGRT